MAELGRALLVLGLLLALGGLLLLYGDRLPLLRDLLARFPLGRLPGDIRVEGEGGGFYFPVVSCLVVSALLSLFFALFRR